MKKLLLPALTVMLSRHIGENTPSTITIEGKQVSISEIPEMQAILAAVAKSERDKLYSRLDSLEKENKSMRDLLNKYAESLQQTQNTPPTQTPQSQIPTQPSQNPPKEAWDLSGLSKEQVKEQLRQLNMENPGLSSDELVSRMMKSFTEALNPLISALNENVIKPTKEKQFADYKAKRLAELGDTVVPEVFDMATDVDGFEGLVPMAKSLAAKYKTQQQQQQQQPTPEIPSRIPIIPIGNNTDGLLKEVKNLSDEEFAKNREALRKELNAHVATLPQQLG